MYTVCILNEVLLIKDEVGKQSRTLECDHLHSTAAHGCKGGVVRGHSRGHQPPPGWCTDTLVPVPRC